MVQAQLLLEKHCVMILDLCKFYQKNAWWSVLHSMKSELLWFGSDRDWTDPDWCVIPYSRIFHQDNNLFSTHVHVDGVAYQKLTLALLAVNIRKPTALIICPEFWKVIFICLFGVWFRTEENFTYTTATWIMIGGSRPVIIHRMLQSFTLRTVVWPLESDWQA